MADEIADPNTGSRAARKGGLFHAGEGPGMGEFLRIIVRAGTRAGMTNRQRTRKSADEAARRPLVKT
jgi:hypothetical protein